MEETLVPNSGPAINELDFESNLILGLIGGGIAMLVSAALWGVITYVTGFQISWMAIGVGIFVGISISGICSSMLSPLTSVFEQPWGQQANDRLSENQKELETHISGSF